MSLIAKLAKNTLTQIIGKAISVGLGLGAVVLLTRYLGAHGFGLYATALTYMQSVAMLVEFGQYLALNSALGRKGVDEQKTFSYAFGFRLISAAIIYGAGALLVFAMGYEPSVEAAAIILMFGFMGSSISSLFTAVLMKHFDMGKTYIAEIIGKIVTFSWLWFAIQNGASMVELMWPLTVAGIIHFVGTALLTKKYVQPIPKYNKEEWNKVWKNSWPIGLGIMFNIIYFRADTLILAAYHTPSTVGLYGAAYRIIEVLVILPHMAFGPLLSLMTNAFSSNNVQDLKKYLQLSFDASAILALPILFGTPFVAEKIIILMAGQDFASAGQLLAVLGIALAAIFFMAPFLYGIVATDNQRRMLPYFGGAALAALLIYFNVIPKYGAIAAAWSTVFIEMFVLIAAMINLWRWERLMPDFKLSLKILLSSLVMAIFLWLVRESDLKIMMVVAFTVYAFMLKTLGIITNSRIKEIIQLRKN